MPRCFGRDAGATADRTLPGPAPPRRAQRPERCFAPEDAATKREEDRARAALARDATAAVAEHGPHWLLLDVFGGPRGAASAGFEYVAGPPPYPLVFDHCPREYRPPLAVAPTLDAFKQNLRYVSGARSVLLLSRFVQS